MKTGSLYICGSEDPGTHGVARGTCREKPNEEARLGPKSANLGG